ncbi:hypothetical protein TCON_2426 [Astathelohania contejeani]|uniref:Uncharacterized protein n=1 Tax=Astathelohania contejeani TaxID=164912 RepID=A0ABQ7HW14_9MICR|nr:hypothetical protein TCON_2426 [Thelohania contejeani]
MQTKKVEISNGVNLLANAVFYVFRGNQYKNNQTKKSDILFIDTTYFPKTGSNRYIVKATFKKILSSAIFDKSKNIIIDLESIKNTKVFICFKKRFLYLYEKLSINDELIKTIYYWLKNETNENTGITIINNDSNECHSIPLSLDDGVDSYCLDDSKYSDAIFSLAREDSNSDEKKR